MRIFRFAALTLLVLLAPCTLAQEGPAQRITTFANPLDLQGADPHVILHEGVYYMYTTSYAGRGFGAWSSRDLVRWTGHGLVYRRTDNGWAQKDFWAPCVIRDGNRFLMYYNAQPAGADRGAEGHRICVAEADNPLGPFRDIAAPMFDPGRMAIDAHVLVDDDGRAYLYYVTGSIWAVPLDRSLTRIEGQPRVALAPDQEWERKWAEAPYVMRQRGKYIMFYSAPGYDMPEYSVAYAVADSPLGPFLKPHPGPILSQTPLVSGPGHNGVTTSPDGREFFMVYHTHQHLRGGDERQIAIDRMRFMPDPNFGVRVEVDGPTTLPQALPSGVSGAFAAASDEFNGPRLDRSRWSIVNGDPANWSLKNGKLVITTQPGGFWGERFDVKNLFLQHAAQGDFEIVTKTDFVVRQNFEQVSLIAWQDHNNYVRLSNVYAGGRRWQIVRELGGRPWSQEIPNTIGDEVWMRITRRGRTYSCAVSVDGRQWWPVGPPLAADFTEVQVGLSAASPGSERRAEAAFEFFRISAPTPPGGATLGDPAPPRPSRPR